MKDRNENDVAIGNLIRDGLQRSGMTQNELAKRLGIQPSSLNQMLSGVAPLPVKRFYQIVPIVNLTKSEVELAAQFFREKFSIPANDTVFDGNPSSQRKPEDQDYIQNRILAIYGALDRVSRAELLTAAERLASTSASHEKPTPPNNPTIQVSVHDTRDPQQISVDLQKAVDEVDSVDNPTGTPRGKARPVLPIFHHEIRCPRCQGLFFAPKIKLNPKIACPFCGQHIVIK